jgi:elongation factor P
MSEIKAGNIRKGNYLLFKNDPCLVTKTDFMSPGKGSAFMRVKLKNIRTGNTQEFTYKSTESVEMADISSVQMQFLYLDADEAVFMDSSSYEQATVPRDLLEGRDLLLTSEVSVYVMMYADKAIGVSFPAKVKLKVAHAEDATAGNTVGQARKNVTLETGLVLQAPVFVKTGETLIIDTETKSYVSRAQ